MIEIHFKYSELLKPGIQCKDWEEAKAVIAKQDIAKLEGIYLDGANMRCYATRAGDAEAVAGGYQDNLDGFKVILEAIEGKWSTEAVDACKEMIAMHEEWVAEANGQLPPPPAEIKI